MKVNKDIVYIVIILLLLGGGFWGKQYFERRLADKDMVYKEMVLKNDSLQKVSDIQSRKLVADTASIKELRNIIKELGIQLSSKPKIVEVIKLVPQSIEKPIEEIVVNQDSTSIVDYYPNKDGYFIKYSNMFSNNTQLGVSNWEFRSFDISIALSQRDDGIWQSDIVAPPYFNIEKVDIVATPLDPPKIDNFGFLLGVGYGFDLEDNSNFIRISSGLRVKKLYINVGANTKSHLDVGLKYEF